MTPLIFSTEFLLSSLAELQARGLADENVAPHGSDLIERDLERYYEMINGSREHLGGLFDSAERRALVEAAYGVIFELRGAVDRFPDEVMYFVEHDELVREHVDANALMTKLDTLSRAARFALVDAVERHWLAISQHGRADLNDLFAPGSGWGR